MNQKRLFLLGIAIAVLLGVYFYRKYRVAPAVNFRSIALTDLANKQVAFETLGGKKTVVCFSASWCPNCLTELRDLNAVKALLKDVNIVVISDEPLEKVQAFAEKTGYPFTFLKMNRSFNAIGINSIPTSYLLNSRQDVVRETVGYVDWRDAATREHLKKLMEE